MPKKTASLTFATLPLLAMPLGLYGVYAMCRPSIARAQTASSASVRRQSSFNAGQARPPEDASEVARGKTIYGLSCQACHGSDLRGGDLGGPNLLRSQVVLTDQHGENITPIIHGARQAQGMPNIGLNDVDANAVAAYVRSVVGSIKGQGMPPGELKPLNIVVGDAAHGHVFVTAHCASCHTGETSLDHIADKYSEPKQLQARWITGGSTAATDAPGTKTTATVTTAQGQSVTGTLLHIDDFLVAIRLADGTEQSFRRVGGQPKVVLHDPMEAHRTMMSTLSDSDIHDVTAYLVTLK